MTRSKNPYQLPDPLVCDPSRIQNGISMELVEEYIKLHKKRKQRYRYLEMMYKGFHDIFFSPNKPNWKPDNRLVANFPRYITDTFMGYAYGNRIKKTHPDQTVLDTITAFEDANEISDHEFELLKYVCIFGHAFEYLYQDEERQTKMTAVKPDELFVVYDDTLKQRALFAVRYGYHENNSQTSSDQNLGDVYGEILTRDSIIAFDGEKKEDPQENPYGYIPVVEYRLNDERIGLFETVGGLIEEYNRVISEKANDVEAFAEAYLAILGAEVDEDNVKRIRDERVINFYGTDNASDVVVQFLTKPTADGTQENLLDRLEKQIYQISMVANISDEAYGNATSGVSLAYKLQAMSNLALGLDRKIEKSLKKRYKIFCSLATNVPDPDAWKEIVITTSRNIPNNRAEETSIAKDAEGLVSKRTQLSLLSYVDDPDTELERIQEEETKDSELIQGLFAEHDHEEVDDGEAGIEK